MRVESIVLDVITWESGLVGQTNLILRWLPEEERPKTGTPIVISWDEPEREGSACGEE